MVAAYLWSVVHKTRISEQRQIHITDGFVRAS